MVFLDWLDISKMKSLLLALYGYRCLDDVHGLLNGLLSNTISSMDSDICILSSRESPRCTIWSMTMMRKKTKPMLR